MDIRKLQRIVVNALEDVKAKDIEVLNTRKLSDLFGRVVIATGDSTRHVRALAKSVEEQVRAAGGEILGVEGEEVGEWVLVDCGDLVCHVMLPKTRAYYDLESLWQTKPKRAAAPAGKA
ncbi:MAG: ribosome silencing factor [Rhodocyclaceae bacterium]|jgi:ribosome-associated protein|nr:ribosome silencing factor [Rhodocyclaceae bacterium]